MSLRKAEEKSSAKASKAIYLFHLESMKINFGGLKCQIRDGEFQIPTENQPSRALGDLGPITHNHATSPTLILKEKTATCTTLISLEEKPDKRAILLLGCFADLLNVCSCGFDAVCED